VPALALIGRPAKLPILLFQEAMWLLAVVARNAVAVRGARRLARRERRVAEIRVTEKHAALALSRAVAPEVVLLRRAIGADRIRALQGVARPGTCPGAVARAVACRIDSGAFVFRVVAGWNRRASPLGALHVARLANAAACTVAADAVPAVVRRTFAVRIAGKSLHDLGNAGSQAITVSVRPALTSAVGARGVALPRGDRALIRAAVHHRVRASTRTIALPIDSIVQRAAGRGPARRRAVGIRAGANAIARSRAGIGLRAANIIRILARSEWAARALAAQQIARLAAAASFVAANTVSADQRRALGSVGAKLPIREGPRFRWPIVAPALGLWRSVVRAVIGAIIWAVVSAFVGQVGGDIGRRAVGARLGDGCVSAGVCGGCRRGLLERVAAAPENQAGRSEKTPQDQSGA